MKETHGSLLSHNLSLHACEQFRLEKMSTKKFSLLLVLANAPEDLEGAAEEHSKSC